MDDIEIPDDVIEAIRNSAATSSDRCTRMNDLLKQSIDKATALLESGFDIESERNKAIGNCQNDDGELGHCSHCGLALILYKVCDMLYLVCPQCKLKDYFQGGNNPDNVDVEESAHSISVIGEYKNDERLWSK